MKAECEMHCHGPRLYARSRGATPAYADAGKLWTPILSSAYARDQEHSPPAFLAGCCVSASCADVHGEWSMSPLSRLLMMCPACRACPSKASIGKHLYHAHGVWFTCVRMFDLSTSNAHACTYSLRHHHGHVCSHKCSTVHAQECATTYRPPEVASQDM